MLRRLLVQVAILDTLVLVGCRNARTDAVSKRTEQPVARSAEVGQHLAVGGSSARAQPAASAAPAVTAKAEPGILEREAWVLVETENLYIPVIDDLGQNLLVANAAVKNGKTKQAAANLRNGAAYLLALHPPEAKAKSALAPAAKELNSVAQDLESGHVVDAKRLAQTYKDAFHADVTGHWTVVEVEETWLSYSRHPSLHLDRALNEVNTNPRAAAMDIREANSYLRVEELRHRNDVLHSAIQELDELADQVEQGKVKDPARIEDAIADSGHALAATHYHVAVDAWQRHDQLLASRQLKESVAHLKRAVGRTTAETKAAVEGLERDAEILVKDTKSDVAAFAKRVESQLRQVKAEIGRLRSKPS
jgi:hypothetical protein